MSGPWPKGTDLFDLRTLIAFMGEMDDSTMAAALGVKRQRIVDWKRGKGAMTPWWNADRLAIHIGTHPAFIWPDWWQRALAAA